MQIKGGIQLNHLKKLKKNQIEMYANKKWYTIKPFKHNKELDVTILRKLILNKIIKNRKNIKFVSGFKGKKALEKFVNSKKDRKAHV